MKTSFLNMPSLKIMGFSIITIFAGLTDVRAQKLSEFYKKDKIVLDEIPEYANKNNWEQLFTDIDKVEFGYKTGMNKGIVVAPDGSVFMCHQTLYEIWKFDKNGNFLKKFGSQGSKQGQFPMHFGLNITYDGKYIYTSDCQGHMLFFDLEGKFIKNLQIDYMPLAVVPLKDSKLGILGFVVGKVNRNVISIKDINTGKEKIIWSYEEESFDKSWIVIKMPKRGMMSYSLPFCHPSYTNPRLTASKTGNLLVGLPGNGEIIEYSPEGTKLKSFVLNITPLTISDEDINENYTSILKKYNEFTQKINNNKKYNEKEKKETIDQFKNQLSKAKDRNLYPKHLPYFSSLMIDSEGNILVFEFTKEEKANKFKAYAFDASGKEIGSSSFVSETFELSFIPSTFCFFNGFIYAVAVKKNENKEPLRLVKFKLI